MAVSPDNNQQMEIDSFATMTRNDPAETIES